jgi:PiT family inorganic phosphate transporter
LVIRIVGLWVLTPVATAALAFVLALALSPLAG